MAQPIRKQTVKLQPAARPSRIRRDPTPIVTAHQLPHIHWWQSREWEIRFAIIGITFFAIGISALVFDLGHLLGE